MVNSELLQGAYLFRGSAKEVVDEAASLAGEVSFLPGEYVYQRGEHGDAFYIVAEGKVELLAEEPGRRERVASYVSRGGHFGEGALLTGTPRFYSARALTKVRLIVFDATLFESKLLANQAIHRLFDRSLVERLSLAASRPVASQDSPMNRPAGSGEASLAAGLLPSQPFLAPDRDEIEFNRTLRTRISLLAGRIDPVLIVGEVGSGRRKVAEQVHREGSGRLAPCVEIDLRNFDPGLWEEKLFGRGQESSPFADGRSLGLLEQMRHGTLLVFHAELLAPQLQRRVAAAITRGLAADQGQDELPLAVRLIFISATPFATMEQESIFLPEFCRLFNAEQIFTIPPLRERKREIPALADYYVRRWAKEYGKKVRLISPAALGLLMKHDWPGNLTELAGVVQRAVITAREEEILSEEILLGLPRSEGKLVYNLLRFPMVRQLISHRFFPDLPRLVILILFFLVMTVLVFGPREATRNIGITLSWFVGWPLLMISFFFLPRFWCSVCALSATGAFLQKIFRPRFQVPAAMITASGWIMGLLCLSVFWVEIVWDAYSSPLLTAGIMAAIATGSLTCCILFQRYAWCRYLCPLGALNGIFSLPSVLELRANRHLCDNQCQEHACYKGTPTSPGCPMFRHPSLVDNNRDCILCGRCIKNCRLQAIQLNLRLAPHELWLIQTPRRTDSLLIAGLAAVFLPLARHHDFLALAAGLPLGPILGGSLLFWGLIALHVVGYGLTAWLLAMVGGIRFQAILAALGYGLVPLVLGGYLAVYVRLLLNESWRLVPNLLLLFGIDYPLSPLRLFSDTGMSTLQHIIILGGLLCSLYAVKKIVVRLATRAPFHGVAVAVAAVLVLAIVYLRMI
jgi:CRP-like cAMP-binding protein/polyferredoxin